jgi:hypothetical protein
MNNDEPRTTDLICGLITLVALLALCLFFPV